MQYTYIYIYIGVLSYNPPVVADHPEDDELDLVSVVEAVPCLLFQASKISENRDSCHLFSQKSIVHTYTHMYICVYINICTYIYCDWYIVASTSFSINLLRDFISDSTTVQPLSAVGG